MVKVSKIRLPIPKAQENCISDATGKLGKSFDISDLDVKTLFSEDELIERCLKSPLKLALEVYYVEKQQKQEQSDCIANSNLQSVTD